MAGLVDLVAGLRCRMRKAAPGIRAPASLRPFALLRGHACGVTIYVLPHFVTYGYIGHWCIGTVRPNEGADGSSGPRYAEPPDGQTEKTAAPEGCRREAPAAQGGAQRDGTWDGVTASARQRAIPRGVDGRSAQRGDRQPSQVLP